jgi:hypothetical protein
LHHDRLFFRKIGLSAQFFITLPQISPKVKVEAGKCGERWDAFLFGLQNLASVANIAQILIYDNK